MNARAPLSLAASAALAVLAFVAPPATHRAEAVASWTDPVVIFNSPAGDVSQSVLVADSAGDVHLLFPVSDGPGAPGALMYMRLHDGRWSPPADILVGPTGQFPRQPSAVLDERGFLHVLVKAGALYYSRAHLSGAANAAEWTKPVQLSDGEVAYANFSTPAALALSGTNSVHVVYATLDGTLRYRRSDDGGESWTQSTTLVDSRGTGSAPDYVRLVVDGQDRIHAMWTGLEYPKGYPPVGIFASRSLDNGESWTEPVRVANEYYGQLNMAVDGAGVLHRIWNGRAGTPDHPHQWSTDGGETWSQARDAMPGFIGGLSGYPALAVDSADVLHFVSSTEKLSRMGIYHTQWNANQWSEPEFISTGSIGVHSIEQPAITISEGNRLHAVWEDDGQRLWYTSRLLDAPTLPKRDVMAPPARPARPVAAVPLAGSAATSRATPLAPDAVGSDVGMSPAPQLLAGAAASFVVITALAAARLTYLGRA